jgi:hypothetical protein
VLQRIAPCVWLLIRFPRGLPPAVFFLGEMQTKLKLLTPKGRWPLADQSRRIAGGAAQEARASSLDIARIRVDGGTQSRKSLSEEVAEQYARLMADGVVFPPVRVWFDGDNYWLSDGFHRVEAARRTGLAQILIELRQGTLDDARWDSFSANVAHGLRRSREDLELIVSRALSHQRTTGLSTNQLAKHLGIPEPTLRRWMRGRSSSNGEDRPPKCVASRNGKTYAINTGNVGLRSVAQPLRATHRLVSDLEAVRSQLFSHRARFFVNVGWCLHSERPSRNRGHVQFEAAWPRRLDWGVDG